MIAPVQLSLRRLPGAYAVSRLGPDDAVPRWALLPAVLSSITRTPEELSIVGPEDVVPPSVTSERGWAALTIRGPLAFDLTGVIATITAPLAEAKIPVFVVSTYDTDVLLVKEGDAARTVQTLAAAGHSVE